MKLAKHRASTPLATIALVTLSLMGADAMAAKVGVGVGRGVEYGGSDDYAISPTASFEVETPIGILKNDRIGAQLDIIKSGTVDTGPVLRANLGRNDSATDPVIAALPEIESTVEAGWFVGSGVKLETLGIQSNAIIIGNLRAVTDLGDGHGGSLVSGSLGLVMPITETFRLVPSVSFNYADENYNNAFYGVSADSAANSELSAFNAKAGLESTQAALVAIRGINQHWSLTGVAAYNFLQGDAAKSPITDRGTDQNLFTGITLNYTF